VVNGASTAVSSSEKSKTKDSKRRRQLGDVLDTTTTTTTTTHQTLHPQVPGSATTGGKNMPFVKSNQKDTSAEWAKNIASTTVIGRAVTEASFASRDSD
jgi:hypothetical protein